MRDMNNECMLEEILNSVNTYFNKSKSINQIIRSVIKSTGLEKTTILKRDFDGWSELDFLIEKMIGELLTSGKINW